MENYLTNCLKRADCVVIPAYEPADVLVDLTDKLAAMDFLVLIVDDGSSSKCQPVWRAVSSKAIVLHHDQNMGKGAALKTAFTYISEDLPDVRHIVTADADGQHLPDDIKKIMFSIYIDPTALVLGSRAFDGPVPVKSKLGNSITRLVFSLVSGKKVGDTKTGLRGFERSLLPFMLSVSGDRYEYEMNVLLNAAEHHISITEVPIKTVYADSSNSTTHFDAVKDSFKIYKTIFKFASVSFVSFLLDYGLFVLFVSVGKFLAVPYLIIGSNITARIGSAAFNYMLNSRFVYGSEQKTSDTLPKYIALAAGILAANSLILSFFTNIVGITPYIAKIMTEISLFIISFTVQSLLIFKNKSGETA